MTGLNSGVFTSARVVFYYPNTSACAPRGVNCCGRASRSHICPGLGTQPGVVGTGADVSACLGLVSRRRAPASAEGIAQCPGNGTGRLLRVGGLFADE